MIKCLYCDDVSRSYFCKNGHYKKQWHDFEVPGNVIKVKVFHFETRIWITYGLKSMYQTQTYRTWREIAELYQLNISRKSHEISESRKMWLLCAKRLKVVPDIRKLIGKMLILEPFEFWDERRVD